MMKRTIAAFLSLILCLQCTGSVYASQLPDAESGIDGAFFDEVNITQEDETGIAEENKDSAAAVDITQSESDNNDTDTNEPADAQGSDALTDAAQTPEIDDKKESTESAEVVEAVEVASEDPEEPVSFLLSAEQIEEKEALYEHADEALSAEEGPDYVPGEILVMAQDEETAAVYADAFGGELKSFFEGMAVILVEDAKEAVIRSADPESNLPAAWLNYVATSVNTEDAPEPVEEDASTVQTEMPTEIVAADPMEVPAEEMSEENAELLGAVMKYNDPFLEKTSDDYQWFHGMIDSNAAWSAGYTGRGVRVAILGSGITSHDELRDKVKGKAYYQMKKNPKGMTKTDNISDIKDKEKNGTGTHMAGIVAAVAGNNALGCGIAPDANLYIANIYDPDTGVATTESLYYALQFERKDWASDIVLIGSSFYGYNRSIDEQITEIYDGGGIVICAAGDDGSNQTVYPAGYTHAVSVGAVGMNNAPSDTTNKNAKIRYSAPGTDIVSTQNGTVQGSRRLSGTPQAAACIAGEAAVILSSGKVAGVGKTRADNLLALLDKGCMKSGLGKGTPNLATSLGIPKSSASPKAPSSSVPSSVIVGESLSIKMTSEAGTTIYYTLDGRKPVYKNDGTIVGERWPSQSASLTIPGAAKVYLKMIAVDNKTGQASAAASYLYEFKPPVRSVSITAENGVTFVAKGHTLQLKPSVEPSYAGNPKVRWDVVDVPKGVIVDKTGKVTVAKECPVNKCRIKATATDGSEVSGFIDITITDPGQIVKKITPSLTKVTVTAGDYRTNSKELSLQVLLSNGKIAPSAGNYTSWYAKNPKIVSLTQTGNTLTIRGDVLGKTTVVGLATDGSGKKTQISVIVKQYVTSVSLSGPKGNTLQAGKSTTLKATYAPEKVTNKAMRFTITDWPGKSEDISLKKCGVSIDAKTGKFSAKKKAAEGSYKIVATAKDRGSISSIPYTLKVTKNAITKLKLTQGAKASYSDRIFRVPIKGKKMTDPDNGMRTSFVINITGGTADFSRPLSCVRVKNSNPKLVKITTSDTTTTVGIEAIGTGTGYADITVSTTDGSALQKKFRVYVSNPAMGLYLSLPSGRSKYLAYHATLKLVPTLITEYGKLDKSSRNFEWESSHPLLVKINKKTGEMTALSEMGIVEGMTAVKIICRTTDGSNLEASFLITPVGRTTGFKAKKITDPDINGYEISTLCKESGSFFGEDFRAKVNKAGLGALITSDNNLGNATLYLYAQKKGTYQVTVSKMDGSKATIKKKVVVKEVKDPVTKEKHLRLEFR